MKLVKLIDRTGSAKSWGPQDVIDAVQKDINDGTVPVGARMMVIYTGPANTGSFVTHFTQCGMSASESIMLLEIAKMDIYKSQMS